MRRLLSGLMALGVGLGFALVLGECAARIALPKHPIYRYPQPRHDPHPVLGWTIRPNQDAFSHDVPVHVNAAGFRDREELEPSKPAGTQRVVVLGDSFTFGNGVPDDEVFSERLERALRAQGLAVRVLNTGVQGWGTREEVLSLRERSLAWEPDAVVLAFYENDVVKPLPPEKAAAQWEQGGEIHRVGLGALLGDRGVYLLKRSRLFTALAFAMRQIPFLLNPEKADYHTRAIYFGEESPESRQAWETVRASLQELRDLCRARDIEPVIFVFPYAGQMKKPGSEAHYQVPLRRITDDLGLSLVDPLDAYRAVAAKGEEPFLGFDGHASSLGHAIAAEAIVAPVAAQLERVRTGNR